VRQPRAGEAVAHELDFNPSGDRPAARRPRDSRAPPRPSPRSTSDRSRPRKPPINDGASLTVNTVVRSGTSTPSGSCIPRFTYRRAWRSDRPNSPCNARTASAGDSSRNRPPRAIDPNRVLVRVSRAKRDQPVEYYTSRPIPSQRPADPADHPLELEVRDCVHSAKALRKAIKDVFGEHALRGAHEGVVGAAAAPISTGAPVATGRPRQGAEYGVPDRRAASVDNAAEAPVDLGEVDSWEAVLRIHLLTRRWVAR
jgi:hypothetical protein